MADNYWAIKPGLNNVGSYQVSGAPWAESVATSTSPGSVTFPGVTRWVLVRNLDSSDSVKVGFSSNGVKNGVGTNYFMLGPGTETPVMEVKVSEIWFTSTANTPNISIIAGITKIAPLSCSGSAGTSWSGSAGVG